MDARQPREENPAYLAWVRKQPCTICARPGPNDPAHLRSAARQYGKRLTGMAEKPDDKWVLPLCRTHHMQQHDHGDELRWWLRMGFPDPFAVALALYARCPVPHRPTVKRAKLIAARKPREQRARVPHNPDRKIQSASNWPEGRKIPTRVRETT